MSMTKLVQEQVLELVLELEQEEKEPSSRTTGESTAQDTLQCDTHWMCMVAKLAPASMLTYFPRYLTMKQRVLFPGSFSWFSLLSSRQHQDILHIY